jgi:hypothetical protein
LTWSDSLRPSGMPIPLPLWANSRETGQKIALDINWIGRICKFGLHGGRREGTRSSYRIR